MNPNYNYNQNNNSGNNNNQGYNNNNQGYNNTNQGYNSNNNQNQAGNYGNNNNNNYVNNNNSGYGNNSGGYNNNNNYGGNNNNQYQNQSNMQFPTPPQGSNNNMNMTFNYQGGNQPMMPDPNNSYGQPNFPTPNSNQGFGIPQYAPQVTPNFFMPNPNLNNNEFQQFTALPFPTHNQNQYQNQNQNQGYNQPHQPSYHNNQSSFNSNVSDSTQPLGKVSGPYLRFKDVDLNQNLYYATVLLVSLDGKPVPKLQLFDSNPNANISIEAERLDAYHQAVFYRYSLTIPIINQEKKVGYKIGDSKLYEFFIPAKNATWRWTFFSCNGYSDDVSEEKRKEFGGPNVLWNDLLQRHKQSPFHCMVGGGDQLYCDDVFKTASLKAWLDIPSRKERDAVVFTSMVEDEVNDYYFNNYVEWFGQGSFKEASAIIPYSMVTDDHDIFDGFGSYPERMMNSQFFQGIFKIAMRFFLLFQHHTTSKDANNQGYFGEKSYSWLKKFGPYTSVLGVDNRSERSITQCLSEPSYETLMRKLYQEVPSTTKHLMVILGIPIVYPRLSQAEGALSGLAVVQHKLNIHKLLHKTGAFAQIVNQFGQPELLDDLNDHWTAADHLKERHQFILRLQGFARDRSIRVSFLAGDVHLGAAGYFYSEGNPQPIINDHRHMTQITSSAIVNHPPPDMVVKMLHTNAQKYTLDNYTSEDMYQLFTKDVDGKDLGASNKCLNRRNWCGVYQDSNTHQVRFLIYVENASHNGSVPYEILVHPLQI